MRPRPRTRRPVRHGVWQQLVLRGLVVGGARCRSRGRPHQPDGAHPRVAAPVGHGRCPCAVGVADGDQGGGRPRPFRTPVARVPRGDRRPRRRGSGLPRRSRRSRADTGGGPGRRRPRRADLHQRYCRCAPRRHVDPREPAGEPRTDPGLRRSSPTRLRRVAWCAAVQPHLRTQRGAEPFAVRRKQTGSRRTFRSVVGVGRHCPAPGHHRRWGPTDVDGVGEPARVGP